jgi:hypothetical protein
VTCYLSPVRALPLVSARLINPAVSIAGHTVTFPVEIPSGHSLELRAANDCKLYGPKGELVREVSPQGALPTLEPGENEVRFQAQTLPGLSPRAHVTVIAQGKVLR